MPVFAIVGANDFARTKYLEKATAEFIKNFGDFAMERLDGEDLEYDRLLEAVSGPPFLSERKMVVLSRAANNKQITERAEELLDQVIESTDLLIVEPKVDKRSAYYKLLKSQDNFVECDDPEPFELAKWVVEAAKNEDAEISQTDARYLIDRVGASQQLLSSELQKLALYSPRINRESIDLLTDKTPSSSVFDLLQAAFDGQVQRALDLYEEQRRLRVEPQAIIGLIAWQLHLLSLAKLAGNRSAAEIAKAGEVSPFAVGKAQALASKLRLADLKQLIDQTLKLDVRLKSESIDPDDALKNLILKIAELKSY